MHIQQTIGYVRLYASDQNKDHQLDLFRDQGVDQIHIEKMLDSKGEHPKLNKLLDRMEPGDTIVVESLSRLGHSIKDLIDQIELIKTREIQLISLKEQIDTNSPTGNLVFAIFDTMSELEQNYIRQRQQEGIAIAKAQGKYKGRKPIEHPDFEQVITKWQAGEFTAVKAAKQLGMSKSTFYRKINASGLRHSTLDQAVGNTSKPEISENNELQTNGSPESPHSSTIVNTPVKVDETPAELSNTEVTEHFDFIKEWCEVFRENHPESFPVYANNLFHAINGRNLLEGEEIPEDIKIGACMYATGLGFRSIILDAIDQTYSTDQIEIDANGYTQLRNLWDPDNEFTHGVPDDIVIADTIPLRDCVIKICGFDKACCGEFRIVIFNAALRKKLSDAINTIDVYGALIWIPIGAKVVPNIALIIHSSDHIAPFIPLSFDNRQMTSSEDVKELIKYGPTEETLEFLFSALSIWYSIQIALLNPILKTCIRTEKRVTPFTLNHGSKKRKSKVKYMKYHIVDYSTLNDTIQSRVKGQITRKTMAWYVIGHWRTCPKSKKKYFVQGFWKGPLRRLQQSTRIDLREREIAQLADSKKDAAS